MPGHLLPYLTCCERYHDGRNQPPIATGAARNAKKLLAKRMGKEKSKEAGQEEQKNQATGSYETNQKTLERNKHRSLTNGMQNMAR